MIEEVQTEDQLTAQQNAEESAARTAFTLAGILLLTYPGAVPTALLAEALWRAGATPVLRRGLAAVASLALLPALAHSLLTGWPWRLIGLGFTSPSALGLSLSGVVHSLPAEATLGPAVALLFELGMAMHERTVIGQVQMSGRRDRRRARALQPGYRPPLSTAQSADGGGMIHLGRDQNGTAFGLGIDEIAQHISMPGGTGSGKTTTIVRLASGALANDYAVTVVDGKAGSLGGEVERLAHRLGVPFQRVHPEEEDSIGYDVCAGDAADVANKLVGAFPFSPEADIYKQVAMQAIPVIVKALHACGEEVTLRAICNVLSTGGFAQLRRQAPTEFSSRLDELQESARDDLARNGYAGLQFRLRAVAEGKFGDVLSRRPALDWSAASSRPAVTYLGLPTTAAAEDVELFGRIVVQDLKQLCSRRLRALGRGQAVQPMLVIFDEFTALREAPQIRDLLLQSRQALMPVVVAQQYLPLDPEIRASILQAGVLLCHRVNAADAEALANELGTRKTPKLTAQIDYETGEMQKGSVREVDEYRLHPNKFRELSVGQAVVFARPTGRRAIVRIDKDPESI